MHNVAELLINILFDNTAREDEREDAAIDIREYKDLRALDALVKIASNPNENDVMVDICAESIGEICIAMNYFDEHSFKKMVPFAQKIVFGFIMSYNPEIIKQSLRNELIIKFECF